MIDLEVERLRRLRGRALRVRAVARVLAAHDQSDDQVNRILERGGCTAWRVARAVSGRLRAHPYARFQRDASVATVVANSFAARAAAWTVSTPVQRLREFEAQLKALSRELDDARSLTRDPDLSDTFARSQCEIRVLDDLLGGPSRGASLRPFLQMPRTLKCGSSAAGDWPYLAF